jgi:hypothetical protein
MLGSLLPPSVNWPDSHLHSSDHCSYHKALAFVFLLILDYNLVFQPRTESLTSCQIWYVALTVNWGQGKGLWLICASWRISLVCPRNRYVSLVGFDQ